MSSDLARYLDERRREIDEALARVLDRTPAPALVADAVRYALISPGKRLRPCLTLTVAESVAARVGLTPADARVMALPAAAAVEMVHAYSLVHDDLPAMDNDTLRRGRPTTHVVFGDGLAILAGDGLLTEAFAVLARTPSPAVPPGAIEAAAEHRLRAVSTLATAAGVCGMVGGQAIDLAAAGRVPGTSPPLDATGLEDMHARKTGALIRAAATMGAIMPGADASTLAAVDDFARELGLAFQIVDDILDVEGSNAALGKTAGKDAASGKPTFPALHGLDESKRRAAACVARAQEAVRSADLGPRLAEIAEWSLRRTA